MLAKQTKLIGIVSLSTLLFILGCNISNVGQGISLAPIRSLTLTIDKNQREELFDQLQKFADEHAYRLVLTEYENIEHFLVELWRDDILITVSDVPPDPSLVYIFFYEPGVSVNEEVIDGLLNDLKSYISEIPNVTISEQ